MKQTYNTKDLVQIFDVSLPTIWRWARDGVIPAGKRMGGKRLWYKPEIDAVLSQLAEQKNPAQPLNSQAGLDGLTPYFPSTISGFKQVLEARNERKN